MLKEICEFLDYSRSSFHTVDWLCEQLDACGFIRLSEYQSFDLKAGVNYYVTRNDSSIIAFKLPKTNTNSSMRLTASHSDCPGFKVKPNAIAKNPNYAKLNTEVYGGPIFSTWIDRPLSLAGRVVVQSPDGLEIKHLRIDRPIGIIPSLAIHMNPGVNKGIELNPQVDLLPMCGLKEMDLKALLAKELSCEVDAIINYDLFLYPLDKALVWGEDSEFISSQHLDDLGSAYASFKAFVASEATNINVYCCFDNEEVGSLTRQGADSDFLRSTLAKICACLNIDYHSTIAKSMMVSCDNAHAVHPNHPEKADEGNRPYMNAGIVIKHNANQSYTSDALGSAVFAAILKKCEIPYQFYTNRSDVRGGSTLGNLSNAQVSFLAVDIGLAQLAMHSAYETAGSKDIKLMVDGLKAFYESTIEFENNKVKVA